MIKLFTFVLALTLPLSFATHARVEGAVSQSERVIDREAIGFFGEDMKPHDFNEIEAEMKCVLSSDKRGCTEPPYEVLDEIAVRVLNYLPVVRLQFTQGEEVYKAWYWKEHARAILALGEPAFDFKKAVGLRK